MFERIGVIMEREVLPELGTDFEALHDADMARIAGDVSTLEGVQIAQAMAALFEVCPRALACHIAVIVLDHLGAGMPEAETAFSDLRADAGFWAGTASPAELREYVAAGCRQLVEDGAQPVALGPRKALLVAIWDSLPEADKRRFLARVDPKGVFRGAA